MSVKEYKIVDKKIEDKYLIDIITTNNNKKDDLIIMSTIYLSALSMFFCQVNNYYYCCLLITLSITIFVIMFLSHILSDIVHYSYYDMRVIGLECKNFYIFKFSMDRYITVTNNMLKISNLTYLLLFLINIIIFIKYIML